MSAVMMIIVFSTQQRTVDALLSLFGVIHVARIHFIHITKKVPFLCVSSILFSFGLNYGTFGFLSSTNVIFDLHFLPVESFSIALKFFHRDLSITDNKNHWTVFDTLNTTFFFYIDKSVSCSSSISQFPNFDNWDKP